MSANLGIGTLLGLGLGGILLVLILWGSWMLQAQNQLPDSPDNPALVVFPQRPTVADLIEVRFHGGGEPRRAWRVSGANAFFVEELDLPARATYALGALAPGEYTFSLFHQVPGERGCRHERVAEVRFTVHPPQAPVGFGQLLLFVEPSNPQQQKALIERENPASQWLFGSSAVLNVIPGLEETYLGALEDRPEVAFLELNAVGFIPECPPPLNPAVAPGSLLVTFKEDVPRPQAEALMQRLPPEWVRSLSSTVFAQDKGETPFDIVWVQVPQGWEALFLQRYERYPEVRCGFIPKRALTPVQARQFAREVVQERGRARCGF